MLVGREDEQKRLKSLLETDKSEFVAVYGRRRIGKTFLIRESFGYNFAFEHTGLRKGGTKKQLKAFRDKMAKCGYRDCPNLNDWADAFSRLGELLERKPSGKKVVFLDECPWLDTARSGFLDELDHFWNDWCTMRKDIVLVICGSAASWIVDKVIDNYGGLHNRLTRQIYLRPFSLHECEELVHAKGIVFNRRQILECYMIMGGVPYYWDLLDKGLGLAQNIDSLFFRKKGELSEEYDHLYSSLFRHPAPFLKVISALGKRRYGLTREEIIKVAKIPSSGNLTKVLAALVQCDFIRAYTIPGKGSRDSIYQLVDNFTIFHQRFMGDDANRMENFWASAENSQPVRIWCGLAFERVALQHESQIKRKLGISGVVTRTYGWRHVAEDGDANGAQVDLVLDRNDRIVNICEVKYRRGEEQFVISDEEGRNLVNKREAYIRDTGTASAVHLTMITVNGVKHNAAWNDIQSEVTLDDLFKE
ncbi:MAG: ATP-binding protein [Kiritimatiellae bacterium]|nr:ATP-binding protein [Kiritimatiellia bacterium]